MIYRCLASHLCILGVARVLGFCDTHVLKTNLGASRQRPIPVPILTPIEFSSFSNTFGDKIKANRVKSSKILAMTAKLAAETDVTATSAPEDTSINDIEVSFSHLHLYVDNVEDVSVYKDLEDKLNEFAGSAALLEKRDLNSCRKLWRSIDPGQDDITGPFQPQSRDIVKQLLAGLGFRVTGARLPSEAVPTNTRSVLVTSKDPNGVQFVVSSIDDNSQFEKDAFFHFDADNVRRFYDAHSGRQGISVLAFRAKAIDAIERRYQQLHPKLILHKQTYDTAKVLEVFSYYKGDTSDSDVDVGTVLRFVEPLTTDDTSFCILPGLSPVAASFDDHCQPAYCDHWVSNVISRTGFLSTLSDVVGFTPKVDFNAGVVAAGEAQIESTVTGNEVDFATTDKEIALKDQSQVFLPINNALSEVGHVHGFLREIGQGVQHIASRVDRLIDFVQRGNDYRKITGEGFTFLSIPRSYYGTLSPKELSNSMENGVSLECADAIMEACEKCKIISVEGAVDLDLSAEDIDQQLDASLTGLALNEYQSHKEAVLSTILQSRYINLYKLLGHHLGEKSYLGLVRNQILVDVQGDDLLYQIFTCNILQRNHGEESPFLEFIQRVCSECKEDDESGCPTKLKAGCGGFGIRNFLTLFLSIEVSKAMLQVSEAKESGDERLRIYAQDMVDCFTDQLNESNPILTEISDAMTEEGHCKEKMEGSSNDEDRIMWRDKMEVASQAKQVGNQKLMECSSKYKMRMRATRERRMTELRHL